MTASHARDAASSATIVTPPGTRLVMPDGWVIAEASVDRLARSLANAEGNVAGIAAEQSPLPAGSSYRVHAERRAMARDAVLVAPSAPTIRGAALVRAEVTVEVGDGTVTVAGSDAAETRRLLVDPGATVHDPSLRVGALEHASALGRPPFPWRPVVLFLGFGPDPALADRARELVNDLTREGGEGRLAVPAAPEGPHVTRPCLPSRESVTALAPDVVVALDEDAIGAAVEWLDGDRSATVIRLAGDLAEPVELVSWRIGRAQGRVRAQIRPDADPRELLELARRLCAGPMPIPPRDRPPDGVSVPLPRRSRGTDTRTRPTVALVAADPAARDRFKELADHARPAATALRIHQGLEGLPPEVARADLVMVRGSSDTEQVRDLVAARRRAGQPTVVDLTPDDMVERPGSRVLAPATASLAETAGLVTTTRRDDAERLRARGLRAHHLPVLLRNDRVAGLRRLRGRRGRSGNPDLGWLLDATDESSVAGTRALVESVLALVPDLTVEVVGPGVDDADVGDAERWELDPRVRVVPGPATPHVVARWKVQVCSTPPSSSGWDAALRTVAEAAYIGVPTIVPVEHPAVGDGLVVPDLTVADATDPSGWQRVLRPLLTTEREWQERGDEALLLAEALHDPQTSSAVVQRFFGWVERWSAS